MFGKQLKNVLYRALTQRSPLVGTSTCSLSSTVNAAKTANSIEVIQDSLNLSQASPSNCGENLSVLPKKVHEVEIKVPWGHMSGKWWGPKNVRPILALHGWQDNAGTFDNIIPLLPQHLSYLAVDLPGHGLSSRIPDGLYYSTAHIIHCINLIRKHYQWDKLSLMAHSMSAIVSFQYTSIFPNNCDLVVSLDALKPMQAKPARIIEMLGKLGDEFDTIDERNQRNILPPSYTFDELVERWDKATHSSVNRAAAEILMKRSVAVEANDPTRFYFTRDSRLKVFNFAIIPHELCLEMAKHIKIPYLFFKATKSPYYEKKQYFDEVRQALEEHNKLFECVMVDGMHHFHLTEPTLGSAKIAEFLHKHRPA